MAAAIPRWRCSSMERIPPPHQMERFGRISFTGELPVAAPRCVSAIVGEESKKRVVEESRKRGSRSSSPSPDARTPGPCVAGSWGRTLMGCSWKMRSRRCEKNIVGMLTEDDAKKVNMMDETMSSLLMTKTLNYDVIYSHLEYKPGILMLQCLKPFGQCWKYDVPVGRNADLCPPDGASTRARTT